MFSLFILEKLLVILHVTSRLVVFGMESHGGGKWKYEGEQGPESWPTKYASCGGSKQSPINIVPSKTVKKKESPFIFSKFDANPKETFMHNNGKYVMIHPKYGKGEVPEISGGGLPGTFAYHQHHFHWGSTSTEGSEHAISGKHYQLEIHIIMTNTKYTKMGEAMKNTDGIAALAVLMESGEPGDEAFDDVTTGIQEVSSGAGAQVPVKFNMPLRKMLPADPDRFYRYEGSTTTPPCSEAVTWTVFKQRLKISPAQKAKFEDVVLDRNGTAGPNGQCFRPLMDLNGRTVYSVTASGPLVTSASPVLLALLSYTLHAASTVRMRAL